MAKGNFASGFAGFLIGVVTGLGIAAAAAVFITKSPMPFVDKVQKVTADVDPAKALSGNVDPNKRLNEQSDTLDSAQDGSVKKVEVQAAPDTGVKRDAAGKAAEPGKVTAGPSYWVQAGAFRSSSAAEERKALLAMNALEAQVDHSGSLWRVRIGPFEDRKAAAEIQAMLSDQSIQSTIVQQK
ncbi:MAG: SPOR domain-containing protein [Burkholderia sp.]